METQRKLNILRDAIAFGGGGILVIFSIIQQTRAGTEVMLTAACLMPGIAGMFLVGMGAYSRKLRNWMNKTEERLNKLERADQNKDQ